MKKLFLLTLLTGLLLSLSTSTDAQVISNRTNCDFEIKITFGLPGCVFVGEISVLAPAMQNTSVAFPAGTVPIKATGRYTNASNCQFFIGRPCSGSPQFATVNCPAACGPYRVGAFSGGIVIVEI